MKYTKNYRLPQWVESDRIMMNDFNSAMTNIESGIDGVKAASEQRDAALTAKDTELEGKISEAKQLANAANQKPYVVGSYVGNNADQTIYLGFRPSFVIVSGCTDSATPNGFTYYSAISGGRVVPAQLVFTSTGFQVPYNGSIFPRLSESGRSYDYIAFK